MNKDINFLPKDKFKLVGDGKKISDTKFDDKPISYFKDAFIRFRKNKASIVAAIIILLIILFALVVPLFSPYRYKFYNESTGKYETRYKMDEYYAKKGPKNNALSEIGIATGTVQDKPNERGYMLLLATGVGADGFDGKTVPADQATEKYMPVKEFKGTELNTITKRPHYVIDKDVYLEVGFIYTQVSQSEYAKMVAWQEETGIPLLYPLIAKNEFNPDQTFENANYWYKATPKVEPLDEEGNLIPCSPNMQFVDNYMRDSEGNPVYYEYAGGGDASTVEYRVRVLYYNYYTYKNGFEPEYIFGTDSQGYDLALRMAQGIQLSLLVAVFVSVINFVLGAMYGAVEGYYGGVVDIVLERVSDILNGVPFIVVATLFQLHLAKKVGPIPSLLFAFVVTGWIGTAARVRTQFYRFKSQEYVMAARTLGAKDRRIIWKHIFPNSLGTIITSSALVIPSVIFSESMLSFLGIVTLGGSTQTSLGTLLSEASKIWTIYPHLMIFPAIVISLLMICFNLFGNGLRDAFNPSLRGVED